MNHPLPNDEFDGTDDNSESPAGATIPTWLGQHYRDDDAEFLVNQYRRKQEEAQASPSRSSVPRSTRRWGPTSSSRPDFRLGGSLR